jgi:AraC family transcriptional regulator
MLRSLATGVRDFKSKPDTLCVRYNWIFLCVFDGSLQPKFDPPVNVAGDAATANFWVIPPQTRYVIAAGTRRVDRAVFHFSEVPDALRDEVAAGGCIAKRLTPAQIAEVRALGAGIEPDFARPTALSATRCEIVLLRLSLLALSHLDAQPLHPLHNVSRDRVEKALAWYSEHMAESPSLRDVAANVHVSQTHLRRHFYERLGRSPKAVFSKLRMQRATQLLVGSTHTLDQIAEACGFNSASDFCRAFKGHFKVTPNAWRRNVNSAERAARE